MKFLIVFALALSSASAFSMANSKLGIINGKKAAVGQFPYQVALYLDLGNDKDGWCGGSLIVNKWIVTAAHCTFEAKSVTVYLGATKMDKPEIKHTVSSNNIINHPYFNSSNYNNDISLVEIPSTPYTDKIRPVKLPAISSSYSTYDDRVVIVSGWGLVSDSDDDTTNDLLWGRMRVITNDECAKTYDNIIFSSTICISSNVGVSSCQGDSGGPMVVKTKNPEAYTLVGVASFISPKGCTKGYANAFTRVTSFLEFIREKTGIFYT